MADVTTAARDHVDTLLGFLIAAAFDSWGDCDRHDFWLDWYEDARLYSRIDRAMAEGDPTAEQRARYEQLHQLMQRNRPYLDQIMRRREERE